MSENGVGKEESKRIEGEARERARQVVQGYRMAFEKGLDVVLALGTPKMVQQAIMLKEKVMKSQEMLTERTDPAISPAQQDAYPALTPSPHARG